MHFIYDIYLSYFSLRLAQTIWVVCYSSVTWLHKVIIQQLTIDGCDIIQRNAINLACHQQISFLLWISFTFSIYAHAYSNGYHLLYLAYTPYMHTKIKSTTCLVDFFHSSITFKKKYSFFFFWQEVSYVSFDQSEYSNRNAKE